VCLNCILGSAGSGPGGFKNSFTVAALQFASIHFKSAPAIVIPYLSLTAAGGKKIWSPTNMPRVTCHLLAALPSLFELNEFVAACTPDFYCLSTSFYFSAATGQRDSALMCDLSRRLRC
jgi:hypothetical protein